MNQYYLIGSVPQPPSFRPKASTWAILIPFVVAAFALDVARKRR